jgi:hypothetical protein
VEVSVPTQVRRQPCLHTEPERGRPVFFIDEYERVHTQYRAIENLDARAMFLAKRQQLLDGVKEVSPVFLEEIDFCSRSYAVACKALRRMGEFTGASSF